MGAKTFSVNAKDNVGNTSSESVSYKVTYKVCTLYDQTKAHQSGSTIPIKLQLCDADNGNVSSSDIVVHAQTVTRVLDGATSKPEDTGDANPENNLRYDPTLGGTGGYIYNLSTDGLGSGTYRLSFTAGEDPIVHEVQFQIK